MIDHEKFKDAVSKTGFPLEYEIQKKFEAHGWDVVSNRYYVDDLRKIEREIDLIAYKSCDYVKVVLVISCKKSEKNYWTFFTDKNVGPVRPLDILLNNKTASYMLSEELPKVLELLDRHPSLKNITTVSSAVRAYTEFEEKKYNHGALASYGLPSHCGDIYNSIITTLKASNYEQQYTREHRMGEFPYFVFHQLSIYDGEMIEYDLETDTENAVGEIKYVNRHIIDGEDRAHQVHFIKSAKIDEVLDVYDQAVEEYRKLFKEVQANYYSDILLPQNQKRAAVLWRQMEDEFYGALYDAWDIRGPVDSLTSNPSDIGHYFAKSGKLHLTLNLFLFTKKGKSEIIDALNKEELCQNTMKKLLKEYFGYEGEFIFERDIEKEKRWESGKYTEDD